MHNQIVTGKAIRALVDHLSAMLHVYLPQAVAAPKVVYMPRSDHREVAIVEGVSGALPPGSTSTTMATTTADAVVTVPVREGEADADADADARAIGDAVAAAVRADSSLGGRFDDPFGATVLNVDLTERADSANQIPSQTIVTIEIRIPL